MRRVATSLGVWAVCAGAALAGCKQDAGPDEPSARAPAAAGWVPQSLEDLPAGLDPALRKIPASNPLTPQKVELGRRLYFDRRLSKDGTVSCATCHDPARGWTDQSPVSIGIGGQKGSLSAPALINRVFSEAQFWDGRAPSLEEQVKSPIENPIEMGESRDSVVAKLAMVAGYQPLFQAAFGDGAVTFDRMAMAIASFVRTVVSGDSPYDRFLAGNKSALSASAVRGREVFFDNQKGRCSICHSGDNFTDEKFHNIGVGWSEERGTFAHLGRFEASKRLEDRGAFKTPTLRNLTETAPYMHDGSETTLVAVVEYYDRGGNKNPQLDKEMRPLNLSAQEKEDLVEFLKALAGRVTVVEVPVPLD
jgi:cytochrome c peroxidase